MDQLIQKLMKSKAIMEASDNIKRGNTNNVNVNYNTVQEFEVPNARYNIPQEFLQENHLSPSMPSIPLTRENTKPVGAPTVDAIKNSKLPDEIKRLMIEHPINQPQQQQTVISDELVQKASRLMRREDSNYVPESAKSKQVPTTQNIDYNIIQKMINEAVESALQKNGLIVESTEKTNETFTFRVGKHIFEGKISKVKKMS